MLKLKPRQRIPKDVTITSLFGFSTDESGRATRMQAQYKQRGIQWNCGFPLFDEDLLMTRHDATQYITERSGFGWRSSRCSFCPLQANRHWREIKQHDREAWKRAVEVDETLRDETAVVSRGMKENMYAHRSCVPLSEANLDEGQGTLFEDDGECEDGCFL